MSITSAGGTINTQGGNTTLSGDIDGRGVLTKAGANTLFITGNNTSIGGITVTGGLLNVTSDSNLGATTAPLTLDGGTLQFGASFALNASRPVTMGTNGGSFDTNGNNGTVDGSIDGAGSLTKIGQGTLTLTGANTYTGGTTIAGGTLAVSNDGNLGGTGGLTLRGGTLQTTTDGFTSGRAVTLDTAGTIQVDAGTSTFSGVIADGSGAGSLTKTGTGTLALTGVNTYTGLTTVSDGTLANGGTIVGPVVNYATLVNTGTLGGTVTNYNAFANSGTVSGLLVNNAGTSTSTGSLTGGATVNGGTLALNGGSVSGLLTVAGGTASLGASNVDASAASILVNGGTFAVGGNSGTVAGVSLRSGAITGTGGTLTSLSDYDVRSGSISANLGGSVGLNKTTAGTVTLTGLNTYTGSSSVGGGTLLVNGSAINSAFTVGAGATVGGTGTLGDLTVQSGGTAAPGAGISQLNVARNVTFNTGSLYQVAANAAGENSRIAAGGTALLQGGTVQVLATPGAYNLRTRYNILNAAGGLTGQFANVTSDLAFLTPSLGYDANNAYLTLSRNNVQFASVAMSRNESQAAVSAQSLGLGNRVYEAVAVLSAPQARTAFNALSGEVHASATTTQFSTAFLTQETILNHLRSDDGSGGCGSIGQNGASPLNSCDPNLRLPATYTADLPGRAPRIDTVPVRTIDPRVFSVWGQGFGSFGSTDGTGNTARLDRQVSGFVLGGDIRLDGNWRLGVAGGYSFASFDVTGRASSGTVESGFGAIYGSGSLGALQLRAGAVVGNDSLNTRRAVTFAGFNDSTSARYGGLTAQAFGEVGYRFAAPRSYIEPFVGGSLLRISHDRFTEVGGPAALTSLSRDIDVATSTVGVRAEAQIGSFLGTDLPIIARGLVGYRRAYGDVVPTALLTFGGSAQTFQTAGAPIDRDALIAQAGLDYRVSSAATLGIGYTGQVGQRAQDHGVRGSFNYRF